VVEHRLPWGTQWDLVRAAAPGQDWAAFRVTLGMQEGRVGGKAPVNRYFGTLTEAGDRIEVGPAATTMMAGSPKAMAAESAFLGLLARVVGFRSTPGELVLTDVAGVELLAFVPSLDPS
jgi:heat shock protein HslJ